MNGKLYGVGVGPGDPELMTLKAIRLIRECDVVMVPGEQVKESVAYQIALRAVPELEEKECTGVHMPMTRDRAVLQEAHRQAAESVIERLKQGKTVAFLNLGDVTVYASFLYIHWRVLEQGFESELINGVPSFCAAAARLGIGLAEGSEPLHVLPQPGQIEEGLKLPGTKVIMKMGKHLEQVKSCLERSGMSVSMIEKCGMPGERIFRSAEEIDPEAGYYSLLIAKEAAGAGKPGTEETGTACVYVVGMGPGSREQMTIQAYEILERCDTIVGYTVYADLLKQEFPDKRFLTTPMRREAERCRMAFEEALNGHQVAMVCSGDAGVYGMSGLMLELAPEYPGCQVKVAAGVTAALAGGAVLGAPLMHDFAVISLSDLLTPWERIEKRLRCAAEADFAICIYNPSSKKRADYLRRACDILLEKMEEDRVCGVVSQIGREGEAWRIMTLKELREYQADMFTTVFVGNSQTKQVGGRMVTPRGYQL